MGLNICLGIFLAIFVGFLIFRDSIGLFSDTNLVAKGVPFIVGIAVSATLTLFDAPLKITIMLGILAFLIASLIAKIFNIVFQKIMKLLQPRRNDDNPFSRL